MAPISYWHDSLAPGDDLTPRSPLPGDVDCDVAIVGAGFSGLWTAYYLLRTNPHRRVVVLERETAGFGASGRNGGWCVGEQAAPLPLLEKAHGAAAVTAMVQELHDAVDEVGAVTQREGIDCDYAKGGAIYLARTPRQLARLTARQRQAARYGHGDAYEVLGPRETTAILDATGVHGSVYTPHAAALHPARLARGLAVAVERLGGTVHEQTAVRAIEPGLARTDRGTVRARVVVRATEGYTASLDGQDRELVPLGNYMIATEPIADDVWAGIGLARREVFEDSILMLGYGNRTRDGRIAWGGMSAPSPYGTRVPPSPMTNGRVARRLRDRLVDLFPALEGIEVTHEWGGIMGVARDLRPGLGLDPATGLAWIGGYFGAGVAAANAAGHALADVITGTESDRVRLPWVGHRSPRWEPAPVRWLGVHAATTAAHVVDRFDRTR